jgi:hypothetical protein
MLINDGRESRNIHKLGRQLESFQKQKKFHFMSILDSLQPTNLVCAHGQVYFRCVHMSDVSKKNLSWK